MGEVIALNPSWMGASIRDSRWHLCRRLWERYEIILAPGDFKAMSKDIREGRAHFIHHRDDGNHPIYLVQVPSCGALVFLAATQDGQLKTAMPVTDWLLGLSQVVLAHPPRQSAR
jgi:hypothetical protein